MTTEFKRIYYTDLHNFLSSLQKKKGLHPFLLHSSQKEEGFMRVKHVACTYTVLYTWYLHASYLLLVDSLRISADSCIHTC